MFDTIKVQDFKPEDNLRFRKRNFVLDDKVIKTISELQYKEGNGLNWWCNIPMTEETIRLNSEQDLYKEYGVIK